MGTRGLSKTAGIILGSVARDVIAKAPVPVTVVK
jgi:nucleotide-binding universal stress UspA family protein